MSRSELTYRFDGTGSGLSDINGMLDIASRITQAVAEGMTMYEFQPVISAYYDGVTYCQKQLITANEPWSGVYSLDAGFYMAMHFTQFIQNGWCIVDHACYGDGVTCGDGHAIVDSTFNYITLVSPDESDASIVIVNNSSKEIDYTLSFHNFDFSGKTFHIWESTGPDSGSLNYYANFFKHTGTLEINNQDSQNLLSQISVNSYSIVTVSSVTPSYNSNTIFKSRYANAQSCLLPLPYLDDFNYSGYSVHYLSNRGMAPRYTTDQGGAFEIVASKDNNYLMQQITYNNKPKDWAATSDPTTNFGDDTWSDYSVSVNIYFSSNKVASDKANYVGVGARYILADNGQSGYWLKLYENGSLELLKDRDLLQSHKISGFISGIWHCLTITVIGRNITASVDNIIYFNYADTAGIYFSGRVALYSDYQNNCFKQLLITPCFSDKSRIDTYYITRIDNLDSRLEYSEGSNTDQGTGWYHVLSNLS